MALIPAYLENIQKSTKQRSENAPSPPHCRYYFIENHGRAGGRAGAGDRGRHRLPLPNYEHRAKGLLARPSQL